MYQGVGVPAVCPGQWIPVGLVLRSLEMSPDADGSLDRPLKEYLRDVNINLIVLLRAHHEGEERRIG